MIDGYRNSAASAPDRARVLAAHRGRRARSRRASSRSQIITDPTEGTTVGLLGVVLFIDDKDQIKYMLAPDARYNQTKGFYPTFRFFGYPTPTRRYSVVLGKSTTKDEDYELEYVDRGLWNGRAFVLANFLHEKDSTERFFGIRNDTPEENEANYTDVDTLRRRRRRVDQGHT